MNTPVSQTQHPFTVLINGKVVGGSYDNISAVTIASCAAQLFIHMTGGGVTLPQVTVEDDTGTVIAVIGQES